MLTTSPAPKQTPVNPVSHHIDSEIVTQGNLSFGTDHFPSPIDVLSEATAFVDHDFSENFDKPIPENVSDTVSLVPSERSSFHAIPHSPFTISKEDGATRTRGFLFDTEGERDR